MQEGKKLTKKGVEKGRKYERKKLGKEEIEQARPKGKRDLIKEKGEARKSWRRKMFFKKVVEDELE